jgi:two-component system, sensor histidine kinase and response regulator
MIRLVVRNLLSNAIKFTPGGGTVSVFTDATDNDVEIIIKDTGEGMDDETLEKIRSNNYYTSQGTAGEQGTGLGLMLCSDFLRKNNGLLRIESTKGKGSTFSFTLPAA